VPFFLLLLFSHLLSFWFSLVTFTRSLTWVTMTRSQSSPLQCRWKRETHFSSSPAPSRTLCWWTSRRTSRPSCPVRSVWCRCSLASPLPGGSIAVPSFVGSLCIFSLFWTDCRFSQWRCTTVVRCLWSRTPVYSEGPETWTGGMHAGLSTQYVTCMQAGTPIHTHTHTHFLLAEKWWVCSCLFSE